MIKTILIGGLLLVSACNVVGNKPVKQITQGKKLMVGKIVLQDEYGQPLSSDVKPCITQSNGEEKCEMTRFNSAAVSSSSQRDMDYVIFEVEPGEAYLSEIKLSNFTNSPNHNVLKAGYTSGKIVLTNPIKLNISPNKDATYFGTINLTTKKVVSVTDEENDIVARLSELNRTGKDISIAKDLAKPNNTEAKTKINYGLSCLMLLNCKCVFTKCDI